METNDYARFWGHRSVKRSEIKERYRTTSTEKNSDTGLLTLTRKGFALGSFNKNIDIKQITFSWEQRAFIFPEH